MPRRNVSSQDSANVSQRNATTVKPTARRRSGQDVEVIDLTNECASSPTKRKRRHEEAPSPKTSKKIKSNVKDESEVISEERRLRRFRAKPPQDYWAVRDRALTQRMFVLQRDRDDDHEDHPVETVTLAGTTGNVYQVVIDKIPTCNCPHALKGHQCKHVIFVLTRVLHARHDLEYQLALLSSELREIFANAPPLPSQKVDDASPADDNRKPIEGDCPICCEDLVEDDGDQSEKIVYCKASCGNNIHKDCFNRWAQAKRGETVTCPFCRTPWQHDSSSLAESLQGGTTSGDGYMNIAKQLGISGVRDVSTYHSRFNRGSSTWY